MKGEILLFSPVKYLKLCNFVEKMCNFVICIDKEQINPILKSVSKG